MRLLYKPCNSAFTLFKFQCLKIFMSIKSASVVSKWEKLEFARTILHVVDIKQEEKWTYDRS